MVYACMQATLLVLHATTPVLRSRATLAAATLTLFAAIFLCTLSRAEHINSVRPSAIINVYLIITLPFDVARSRTLWLDGATKSVAAVFTSAVCLKVMIRILEAVEKRSILLDRYRYSSPEVTSGIYSRSFFWWLNNLMTIGFRRVITHQDLYPIDDDMTSQVLSDRAHGTWKSTDQTRRRALLW
jgi:ATP-binding cassette subfamily C (CFTR/MRP) protein 1